MRTNTGQRVMTSATAAGLALLALAVSLLLPAVQGPREARTGAVAAIVSSVTLSGTTSEPPTTD